MLQDEAYLIIFNDTFFGENQQFHYTNVLILIKIKHANPIQDTFIRDYIIKIRSFWKITYFCTALIIKFLLK